MLYICLQRLRHLQEEMAEAKEGAKDTEALLRMWESLASKAHQIPSVSDIAMILSYCSC